MTELLGVGSRKLDCFLIVRVGVVGVVGSFLVITVVEALILIVRVGVVVVARETSSLVAVVVTRDASF